MTEHRPAGAGANDGVAIEAQGLVKSFPAKRGAGGPRPRHTAVDGVSLTIRQGEFLGLVGANGAGKTTLIKILTGILAPDCGLARVNGFDLATARREVKASSTLIKSGGWTGLLYQTSVLNNIRFYGRLAGLPGPLIERRALEILDVLDLAAKCGELPWYLSAGQRQKACLAMMAIVITPVVFLDEPTAHLDPAAAANVRRFLREVMNRERGQTVFMSTHYLDEAELLCDRVAILDRGRVVACGTPAKLRAAARSGEVLEISVERCSPPAVEALGRLPGVLHVNHRVEDPVMGRYLLRVHARPGGENPTPAVLASLSSAAVEVRWLRTIRPTLQEVYFELVGRDLN